MKNIKYLFLITLVACLAACSEGERPIDEVLDNTTAGGILRTISVNNSTFSFSNPSEEWSVTVEAQDAQDGDLLEEVGVYVNQYRDGSRVGSEAFVKAVPASEFTEGQWGYPVGDINVSLAEATSSLGLSEDDYMSTDEFRVRLEYVMTDGRTFSNSDASGTVLSSSFWRSPYLYSVQFFCDLDDASLFDGMYTVTADVWADYAVGDQVPVEYNPEDGPYTFRILTDNNPYLVNAGSAYMLVTIDPTDGSVTISANEEFDYGGGFVVPISGTGSVGTCTGSINLSVNFGPSYPNQAFNLVPTTD